MQEPATASLNESKIGVLLVNLGTPDSTSIPDVRKYLREFLLDPRVIDIPTIPRQLLVNGIIAPFRAPKSAKAYKAVWDAKTGSPLKHYSLEVERHLQERLGNKYVVKLAMRYQNPSIDAAIDSFKKLPLEEIIVVSLFPQYASATTGSVVEAVSKRLNKWQTIPSVRYINRFFDDPKFIHAFAEVAKPYLSEHKYEKVLFSYHGLPERQIRKGDALNVCKLGECCNTYGAKNQWCYRAQCFATTRLLVEALGLEEGTYMTTFQSRLGNDPWIKPYTEETIRELRKQGIQSVAVMSPAFVADCLETIEEIGGEYKELFEELGGEHWQLIPSLNDSPLWIEALGELITRAA
jgi:ferrochelatase